MTLPPPQPSAALPPAPPRPRVHNPRTQAKLRRDVFWQIGLPLGLALAAVVTLGVLVVLPLGAPVRSPWADVSLIFLILPTLVAGIITLVLVAALVGGMIYLLREAPYFFKLVQDFMAVFSYRIQAGADKVSAVFLSIRSVAAGAQRAVKTVQRAIQRGG